MKTNISLVLAFICFTFSSCIKEVDFNQPTDLNFNPIFETSVIYYTHLASSFDEDDGNTDTVEDNFDLDIFTKDFSKDTLEKTEFYFEIRNSINRDFEVEIEFLDKSNDRLHEITIQANASNDNSVLLFTHTETFNNSKLKILENTYKIKLLLTLKASDDGSILNANSPGEINLKSKVLFYLNVNLSS